MRASGIGFLLMCIAAGAARGDDSLSDRRLSELARGRLHLADFVDLRRGVIVIVAQDHGPPKGWFLAGTPPEAGRAMQLLFTTVGRRVLLHAVVVITLTRAASAIRGRRVTDEVQESARPHIERELRLWEQRRIHCPRNDP